ncbi:hypothetical protein GCM10009815_25770 [Nocardioides marmoribigeumensis]
MTVAGGGLAVLGATGSPESPLTHSVVCSAARISSLRVQEAAERCNDASSGGDIVDDHRIGTNFDVVTNLHLSKYFGALP